MNPIESIRKRGQAFRERMIARNFLAPNDSSGCTEDEIKEIEGKAGGPLPEAYKVFLRLLGKRTTKVFDHVNMFVEDIEANLAIGGVTEESDPPVPKGTFPCWTDYLGEVVGFFHLGESEDPAIYRMSIETGRVERIGDSLWDMMEAELEVAEKLDDDGMMADKKV